MSHQELSHNHREPGAWKYVSSPEPGMHTIIDRTNSPCRVVTAYRINLGAGDVVRLDTPGVELSAFVVRGSVAVEHGGQSQTLSKLDAVYLPGHDVALLRGLRDSVVFAGGAPYEGVGSFFIWRFEPELPLGDVHQVHGQPPFEREVFLTLGPTVPASRLITGVTWGAAGMWTSWPPHQHTRDLEEIYCYFDVEKPDFVLHLSSRRPNEIEAVHVVQGGDFVIIPEGYHPTVASPGSRSCYFWIMGAHSRASRRYDLARTDFAQASGDQ